MGNFVNINTKEQGIALIEIDNPPFNVLSRKVVSELDAAFTAIEKDKEVVVAILTGAGNKAFMAGADIKEFPEWFNRDDVKEITLETHEVLNRINELPKPTIAVLNGVALGGGG